MFEIFKSIGEAVSNTVSKVSFELEKNSPTICLVTGIVGVGVAMFATYKATLKLPEVIEETNEEVKKIEAESGDNSTEDTSVAKAYVKGGLSIAKLYAPAVIISSLSVVLLLRGHHELMARNAALAAYALGLQKEFDEYRENVRLVYGEDADKKIRFNIVQQEQKKLEGDISENKTEETAIIKHPMYGSTRFLFDASTTDHWTKNVTYNMDFVSLTENDANTMLRIRGHLFLNEVLDMLGLPRTVEGQRLGWVYDPNVEHKISFGAYQWTIDMEDSEPSIWLEFNIDGDILSKLN